MRKGFRRTLLWYYAEGIPQDPSRVLCRRAVTLSLQCVTLSNDLEWSKHIATMTNKANSKLWFLRRNLKGCIEKLKQTAYFSLIRSFMEYGATVCDPYQKYNSDKMEGVQRRAARLSKVGIRDTLLFLICLMCWGGRLFLKRDRRLDLFCFTKLLTVWHKCHSKASLSRRIRVLEENTA